MVADYLRLAHIESTFLVVEVRALIGLFNLSGRLWLSEKDQPGFTVDCPKILLLSIDTGVYGPSIGTSWEGGVCGGYLGTRVDEVGLCCMCGGGPS